MLRTELVDSIVGFARSHKYLIGISDHICGYMLSSFKDELVDIFAILITNNVLIRLQNQVQAAIVVPGTKELQPE